MAKKKLYLEQRWNRDFTKEEDKTVYVVKKVVGSTEPRMFDTLGKGLVDTYCADENWEVTIT